jgi:glucosylceramidase
MGGPNHLGNMCDAPLLAVPYRVDGQYNTTVVPSFEHADFPFGPIAGDSRTREELNAMGVPAEYLDKGIVVQPMFYYMGHISRYVRPGSRAVHAIVDQPKNDSAKRTFLQTVENDTIVGGGINNLARKGIEATLWPCEGSTRQQWKFSENDQLQVFGHDWLGKPTVTCLGSTVDPSFEGLLLTPCDETAGTYHIEETVHSTVKIVIESSDSVEGVKNCLAVKPLENNGGAYGPRGGAQLVLGSCDGESVSGLFPFLNCLSLI